MHWSSGGIRRLKEWTIVRVHLTCGYKYVHRNLSKLQMGMMMYAYQALNSMQWASGRNRQLKQLTIVHVHLTCG